MNVLVINSGSSSLKFQLINTKTQQVTQKGTFERIGITGGQFNDHKSAVSEMFKQIGISDIGAIGHRVVHGGEAFKQSTLVTKETLKRVKEISHLAPLHNPANIMGIEACMEVLPNAKNVMVFDTAFHAKMPKSAFLYALPCVDYEKHGIRRYGFHGTSHNYVSRKTAELFGKPVKDLRIITVHLGNGCSIAAVDKGISIETSMGLTPLEGLVMGTRCGDIDPAAVQMLSKVHNFTLDETIDYLNKKSGLFGLTGGLSDMRDITAAMKSGNALAKTAIDIFTHRIIKYLGAYIAVMGGADAIAFTGGIGSNEGGIRSCIMENFKYAGALIDDEKNNALIKGFHTGEISAENAKIRTFVIKTDEEFEIANETALLLK